MLVALIAAIGAFTAAATGQAATNAQDVSLVTTPMAPRGGVLLLPILLDEGARVRPRDLVLRRATGVELESRLVWFEWNQRARPQSWTSDPRALSVVPARQGDEAEEHRRLFLMARLPQDGAGELRLGNQRLRPIWLDVPETDYSERGGRLALVDSPARPDPRSPLEYWRWVLLADQFAVEPPDRAAYGELGSMIAEHFADLWAIGLSRLEAHDPNVAEQVRNILTRICIDEHHAFAAWATDAALLSQLLALLLDTDQPATAVATAARAWAENQERPLLWLESESADAIDVAVVNPAGRPVVARFSWVGTGAPSDAVPIAVELPEGRLTRARLDRPLVSNENGAVLRVQIGARAEQLLVGPSSIVVKPPGLTLPPLQPALTLANARSGQSSSVTADRATLVQIRKRAGRWEVFIESLRPEPMTEASASRTDAQASQRPSAPEETRGREGVLLFLSRNDEEPPVQLFVPESGWHELFRGENDGTLQVHRQSYHDRWYCRVVLPERWLNTTLEGDVTGFGVMRTHGDSDRLQYAPHSAPPWRAHPGLSAIDLTQWGDLPGVAGQ